MSPKLLGSAGQQGWHMSSLSLQQGTQDRGGRPNNRSTSLIKGFVHRQKGKGPVLKDCQH